MSLQQKLQKKIIEWKWCLVYCRVSSERQVKEGNGLSSQEKRCRDYAQQKGYIVVEVFYDEGVSGGLFERPAMHKLIDYLDNHASKNFVVLFDDLARFARDVKVHVQLKTELESRGVKLECLNFNFDDSPAGELIELIMASFAQYHRKDNRRQVMQKMKARLQQGYWPFCPPPAVVNQKHPLHGKILTNQEPFATIYKDTIEKYRDGLLNTLEQVCDFIAKSYKEHGIKRPISISGSMNILTNPLYAGYIEYEPWDIPFMKAKHNGFITIETFNAVQEKLKGKAKASMRSDYNLDFPLRNFVLCSLCNKPLTASWHKGRKKKYPHYFCKQKGCEMRDKNVLKDVIETRFEELLVNSTPNEEVLNFAKGILMDIWNNRDKVESDNQISQLKVVEKLLDKKKFFLERISKTTNEDLIQEYENELNKILQEIKKLNDEIPRKIYINTNFGTACDVVFSRIENPIAMWRSKNYKDQRLLLEMYFEDKIPYDLKNGFGTANLACLVKLLTTKPNEKMSLVEMGGVEPPSEETQIQRFS